MKITDIRVRNFRSIESEQHIRIPGQMTLVGPNNSGKTNVLRAIQAFFTGTPNLYGYSRDTDLTFGVGRAQTSITATFDGDPALETDIYDSIDELHELQGTVRKGTQLPLTLYFTQTNTPVYGFFPNVKRPKPNNQAAQYSRTHIALVNRLLDSFSLHYVPSAKSVEEIYRELLNPFLRRKVAEVLQPHLNRINDSLGEAAAALNHELASAELHDYSASFALPGQSIEELLSGFDLMIEDPQRTSIQEKGMGIQTTALLAAFRWISSQETDSGRQVLWLLEEPESYLHPNLASNCKIILDNLAREATVIRTTHSMAFVPQDPQLVCGTKLNDDNRTEIQSYSTYNEATSTIRTALGVKFGDFYNLSQKNVFVEGQTDREIFNFVISQLPAEEFPLGNLRAAEFEDFGGVKHLSGFLRATYQFIRKEYACVTVFDGDDAGDKERRHLQGYFGNNDIPFEANKHFVSVRTGFPIEGLFPDAWIKDCYEDHPGWFENFSVDVKGNLQPFQLKTSGKASLQNYLVGRADAEPNLDWATGFVDVFEVIDSALETMSAALSE